MSYLEPYADEAEATSEANYFVRHWRGYLSLPVSYWVNGGILFAVTSYAGLLLLLLSQEMSASLRTLSFLAVGYIVVLLLVRIWGVVGIWRSAGRHVARRGSAFWAATARIMVVLGVVTTGIQARNLYQMLGEFGQIAIGRDPIGEAASFALSPSGEQLIVTGYLTEGTGERFKSLANTSSKLRTVVLNSAGGRLHEAQLIASIVKQRRLDTHVSGECSSACTLVLVAGNVRTASASSGVGFHQLSFPGLSASDLESETRTMLAAYDEAGIPRAFQERVARTAPEDLWVPSFAELKEANVITDAGEQLDAFVAATIKNLKPAQPKRIDDLTMLVDVTGDDGKLIFVFRVAAKANAIDGAGFRASMFDPLVKDTCADPAYREAILLGGEIIYSYKDSSGKPIDEFVVNDCGPAPPSAEGI